MSEARKQLFRKQAAKNQAIKEQGIRDRAAAEIILADLFVEQRNFVLDPDRRKSLLTPRRAGKTFTAISYALYVALTQAESVIPIITLTLRSAKRLYRDPIMKASEQYGLNITEKAALMEFHFPNGSKIFLTGAENKKDIEKLRGGAYALVLIDECKSFNIGIFEELVDDILRAATNDTSGTICIIGTPASVLAGPFFEATYPGLKDEDDDLITRDYYSPEKFWEENPTKVPLWSRHHWTTQENVHCPHIWENFQEDKHRRKWADDNPTWLREALGRWVSMGDTMVYALNTLIDADRGVSSCRALWRKGSGKDLNKWGLPKDQDWRFILGMDMGFNDSFALVVVAYSPYENCLYQVYEEKAEYLIVPQIASVIQRAVKHFDDRIEAMVADTGGLGKMIVETLNSQYGFYIEPAEKTQKLDHIELLNSDMYDGKFKVMISSELHIEMSQLQWDFRGLSKKQAIKLNRLREDPSFDNHLCDAALYTWRFSLHHFSREREIPAEKDTTEYYLSQDEKDYQEAVQRKLDKEAAIDTEWTDELFDDGEDYFNKLFG